MKYLHMIAFILLVVGGLNWLAVGALNMNIVESVFGMGTMLTKAIYVLVGLSAILEVITHKGNCKLCGRGAM